MDGEKKPNNILRRERQLRGWSQQKIAELVGTSEDVVSRWERGERTTSPFFQEKFCVLYGKNAEELGFIQLHLNQPSTVITLVTDINQAINERLDQAESIINLAWEAWFASRPKLATRETTKLLPGLERMIYMPLATVQLLRTKELVIRCHGLLGAMYLDALQNDSALYHYIQAHKFAEESKGSEANETMFARDWLYFLDRKYMHRQRTETNHDLLFSFYFRLR